MRMPADIFSRTPNSDVLLRVSGVRRSRKAIGINRIIATIIKGCSKGLKAER